MNRWHTPLITVLVLGLTMLVGLSIVLFALHNQPPAPSITYRYPVVETGIPPMCPGDSFSYRQEAQITDAPASLRIVTTVWSVGEERSVVQDTAPRYTNYPRSQTVRIPGMYTVPQLAPGQYELRVSATGESWRTAMYVVPFAVRVGCP